MNSWGDAKKVEVVTTYLALGKCPMVSAVTGVPVQTIRYWRMQPWWKELENEIRSDETTELDSKLTKIIDRSLDAVADRIDNGDWILDSRSGSVRRIPVKLRDVHKVGSELIDKRSLIRTKKTSEVDKTTVEDVIKKLADQFADFVKYQRAKEIKGEIIEEVESDLSELSKGDSESQKTNTEILF